MLPKLKKRNELERREALPARAADDPIGGVVSTETAVPGMYHPREVLSHADGAVDLSAVMPEGLPVRLEHAGRVVARAFDLDLSGRRLRVGRIEIAPSQADLRADVDAGMYTHLSVKASFNGRDVVERGEDLVIEKWRPKEISLVALAGDEGATIERNDSEDQGMDDTGTVGLKERASAIEVIFKGLEGAEWADAELAAVRSDKSLDVIRADVMDLLKKKATSGTTVSGGYVQRGEDTLDKYVDEAQRVLDYRVGVMAKDERAEYEKTVHRSELSGLTLKEMGREYLRRRNLPLTGGENVIIDRALSVPGVVERAGGDFGHGTSDFANILAVTADKSLGQGYTENGETYQTWVGNRTVSNFRSHTFPVLSTFGDLLAITESGEYDSAPMTDKAEAGSVSEYGRTFNIGRRAIINDDLGAFGEIPAAMGRAAARLVGDLVYGVLTANAVMTEDGVALFAAGHGNLAGAGAAVSTATLGAARLAMRTQTALAPGRGEAGATLNTVPRYLISPAATETAIEQYLASQKDPAEGTTTSFDAANVIRNLFELVVEPRLDADSATQWYVAAAQGSVRTVSILWLNGVQRPVLDQETGFMSGRISYGIRIDAGAMADDYRGLYANPGA